MATNIIGAVGGGDGDSGGGGMYVRRRQVLRLMIRRHTIVSRAARVKKGSHATRTQSAYLTGQLQLLKYLLEYVEFAGDAHQD